MRLGAQTIGRTASEKHVSPIDLRELTDRMIEAVDAHVSLHQVGLLLFGRDRVDCASGVCIQLGPRYFVATAGHNLVGIPDEKLFIVAHRNPTDQHTPIQQRWPCETDPRPTPDLGYIELSADAAESLEKSFVSLERLLPERGYSDNLFYYLKGFPSDQVPKDLAMSGEYQLRTIGFFIRPVDPAIASPDVDPDVAILLEYRDSTLSLSTGERIDAPDPQGLSGGGIGGFPRAVTEAGIWSPGITELLGIDTGRWRDSKLLSGVQIQHWLRCVARDYPEIAELLPRVR